MRWMQPPQLDDPALDPALDRFDPVDEGARHRLSPEQSLALWKRVCTEASDEAGRRNDDEARRRFRELAAQGGRPGPEVGKRTRVELDDAPHDTPRTAHAGPTAPGRDSLVAAEARRQRSVSMPAISDTRRQPSSTAPATSDVPEQPSPTVPAMSDAREPPPSNAQLSADARHQTPPTVPAISDAPPSAMTGGWRPPLGTPVTPVAPWQPSQNMRLAAVALQMRQGGGGRARDPGGPRGRAGGGAAG